MSNDSTGVAAANAIGTLPTINNTDAKHSSAGVINRWTNDDEAVSCRGLRIESTAPRGVNDRLHDVVHGSDWPNANINDGYDNGDVAFTIAFTQPPPSSSSRG